MKLIFSSILVGLLYFLFPSPIFAAETTTKKFVPVMGGIFEPKGKFGSLILSAKGDIEDFEQRPQGIDFHLYCMNGSHIGVNYKDSKFDVPAGTRGLISGPMDGAPEWIYVPATMFTKCRFVVSTYDYVQYLKKHPELASKITDKTDSYGMYLRYVNSVGMFESKKITNKPIKIGMEAVYKVTGTTKPVLTLVREVKITTSSPKCKKGTYYCQYF